MDEQSIHSLEPANDVARAIALDGMVLRGLVGSTVHGLSNPGTDDRDEMGVCIEPPSHVLGLRRFEHYVSRTQPEGQPSGPGDLDLTVYSLRKFARLALKGSPTALLLLFIDGDDVMVRTPVGARLQELAPEFFSHRTGRAFLGYIESQRRGLTGERHATRTRELSLEHGYDTKYAMHAVRIGLQGVELLATGRISLPMQKPDRQQLRDIRAGTVPLDDVLELLDATTARLEALARSSDLPADGNHALIDDFLVDVHLDAWQNHR